MGDGTAAGPLSGVRALELAAIGPVPFAGQLLRQLGADVVVVDPPGARDLGIALPDDPLERSKPRLAIDLKGPAGRARLLEEASRSDILVEGFRPGKLEALGLAPADLWSSNPALVIGRCGGWGVGNPRARSAGHDINYLALSGVLGAIGPAARPVPPLNLVADFGGGAMHLLVGVTAALTRARATGRGTVVATSIFEGAVSLSRHLHGLVEGGVWRPGREDNLLDGGAPFYRCYRTADGGWLAVGAIEPKFFAVLVGGLGVDLDLARQYDRAYWPRIERAFAERIASRTRDAWDALFAGTDACATPVVDLRETLDRPDAAACCAGGASGPGIGFEENMTRSSDPARAGARGGPPEASDGRTLILDTAARLFSGEGYSSVSLRDIAGECGMKAASLYYHFASKEEIVVEVLKTGVERVSDEVRRTVAGLPPDADAGALLNAAIRAHLSALLEQHDYTSANVRIFSQVPRSVRQLLITVRDNYEAYWTSLLARCAERGGFSRDRNLHLARLFLLATLNGTLEWYQPGERSIDHVADELTAIFLGGLAGRPDAVRGRRDMDRVADRDGSR